MAGKAVRTLGLNEMKVVGKWNKIFTEIFRSRVFASFSGVLDRVVLILDMVSILDH